MAKYFIQRENLVSIADEVRTISGVTNTLPINTMKSSLQEANNNINTESELISQIMSALQGKTNAAIPEVSIKTTTKKLSSNGTTITFEGLSQEPKMFAITPTGNITLGSTRYVTGVMYDGTTTSGTYGYRSSSSGTSYYSESYFTWTYSDGVLTVKTSSSTNGGNFSSSATYKLAYVEANSSSSNDSESALWLIKGSEAVTFVDPNENSSASASSSGLVVRATDEYESVSSIIRTTTKYDLTNAKTIFVTTNGQRPWLAVWNGNPSFDGYTDNAIAKVMTNSTETKLDVSSLTGSYYIGFFLEMAAGSTYTISELRIV